VAGAEDYNRPEKSDNSNDEDPSEREESRLGKVE
jgi:hypothetical protein